MDDYFLTTTVNDYFLMITFMTTFKITLNDYFGPDITLPYRESYAQNFPCLAETGRHHRPKAEYQDRKCCSCSRSIASEVISGIHYRISNLSPIIPFPLGRVQYD